MPVSRLFQKNTQTSARSAASAPAAADSANPVRATARDLIDLAHDGERLSLKSINVRALQSGQYTSPFKGRGMEFDETRLYQPGDDIRCLDWKVTARTGKAHTKLFREERERPILVWVDLRPSMFFATRGAFKSVVAARIATLLGWSAVAQGDRLGGLIFSANDHQEIKPRNGKNAVLRFIKTLSQHSCWHDYKQQIDSNPDSGNEALLRLRNVARPGSLIFLCSDFRQLGEQAEAHLSQIARHNDVVAINITDPLEAALPNTGHYRFNNGYDEVQLNASNKQIKQDYQARFAQHQQSIQRLCQRSGAYLFDCQTNSPLTEVLITQLGLKRR